MKKYLRDMKNNYKLVISLKKGPTLPQKNKIASLKIFCVSVLLEGCTGLQRVYLHILATYRLLSLTFKAKIQKFLSWNLTTETENFVMSTFKLCINSYIENSGIIHIIPLKIPKISLKSIESIE